jgi:circadian clock protein KaiC
VNTSHETNLGHPVVGSGVPGLDEITQGGFLKGRAVLLQGSPGSGKTTLGMQFLLEGVSQGETCLFVTLSQTRAELEQAADSHGWSLEGIEVEELTPHLALQTFEQRQTVFSPAEVELPELSERIRKAYEQLQPDRIVIDSMGSIRILAGDQLAYRREVLRLKQLIVEGEATVLMLDGEVGENNGHELQGMVQSVLRLEQRTSSFLPIQRFLDVVKMRGQAFVSGKHDFQIRRGGLEVYPRLISPRPELDYNGERAECGESMYDQMLGGGLEYGTSCIVIGQSGTGKSSLSMLHPYAAAKRGEPAALLLFEERLQSYLARSAAMGYDLKPLIDAGTLHVHAFRAGDVSAGEFSHRVRELIDREGVRVVTLDSLTGLINTMPGEQVILTQISTLLAYMSTQHVLNIMTVAQHGLVGYQPADSIDASYLADSVVLLRHFETAGRVRKSITVVKKRHGAHELSIRELLIDGDGVRIGEEITDLSGILTGQPDPNGP